MAQLAKTQHLAYVAEASGEAPAMGCHSRRVRRGAVEGIVPAPALLGRTAALMAAAEAPGANLSALGLTAPRLKADP